MRAPRRVPIRRVLVPLGAIVALAGTLLSSVGAAGAAGGADWSTYGYDDARTGYNPNETILSTSTVGGLHEVWSYDLGAVTISQPAFASGVMVNSQPTDIVYEGSEHGHLVALNAATGALIWDRDLGSVDTECHDMPDTIFGVSGTPVIVRSQNLLFEAGGDGQVYALDLSTGETRPGWPVAITTDPVHEHVYGGMTLLGRDLYVATASMCDFGSYHGHIVDIDVVTATRKASWYTVGKTVIGGGIWGPGGVSVDTATKHVFTATGNAFADPESYRFAEHVVELGQYLRVKGADYPGIEGTDSDFGATPILFHAPGCPPQVAAKNKTGFVVVYTRGDVTAGATQRLQIAAVTSQFFNGIPAWDPTTNRLFIGNSSASSPYVRGMVALKIQGDCTLALDWQNSISDPGGNDSMSPPTVANGVVYYGNGFGKKEWAFDAATGTKLWDSGSTITANIYAAPTVINGMLFVGSWDHKLHAFGL